MSGEQPVMGTLGWFDLTVADAPGVRDFYQAVVGWTASGVDMSEYEDFTMSAADGKAVAGVCHARGSNEGMPAQWLAYVHVANLDASLSEVVARGGEVLRPARSAGGMGRFAVIRDPAGAALALFEPAS